LGQRENPLKNLNSLPKVKGNLQGRKVINFIPQLVGKALIRNWKEGEERGLNEGELAQLRVA